MYIKAVNTSGEVVPRPDSKISNLPSLLHLPTVCTAPANSSDPMSPWFCDIPRWAISRYVPHVVRLMLSPG